MDNEYLKQRLLDKERELRDEIDHLGGEAWDHEAPDALDYTEVAQIDQGTSEALDEAMVMTSTLEEVRDALQRIEAGAYGACVECGEPIEPARLEAVPWTLRCRKDQEKQDVLEGVAEGTTL